MRKRLIAVVLLLALVVGPAYPATEAFAPAGPNEGDGSYATTVYEVTPSLYAQAAVGLYLCMIMWGFYAMMSLGIDPFKDENP